MAVRESEEQAMSDEYTPTTEQVRSAWIFKRWDSIGQLRSEGSDAEVDRWLAAHDAEIRTAAQAEAWDQGHKTRHKRGPSGCRCGAWSSGECGCGLYGSGELLSLADNPYRAAKAADL